MLPSQISVHDYDGGILTKEGEVASGAVGTIFPGTPTKLSATSRGTAGTVIPMVDADGTTSQVFTGIAKSQSSDTATVAGSVQLIMPLPGIIYAAKAKSPTGANTQTKINNALYGRFVFDLTGTIGLGLTGAWTIDLAGGDGSNNCIVVVGGEYQTNTVYFIYQVRGSYLNA